MKTYIRILALKIARWAGAVVVERPDESVMLAAHEFCNHVASQPEPPEWKRRQVLRALCNRFPAARLSVLNLAIEIAVQECSES